MTDTSTRKLEGLLANGGDGVTLGRRDVQEIAQKLRARGGENELANRLDAQLGAAPEVTLARDDAQAVLEELRASGRSWVFGRRDGAVAEMPQPDPGPPGPDPMPEPTPPEPTPPSPMPEPQQEQGNFLSRLFSRG